MFGSRKLFTPLALLTLVLAACSSDKGTESSLPQVNLSAYITSTEIAGAAAAPLHGSWMNTVVIGGQKIVKLGAGATYSMALIANDDSENLLVDNDQIVSTSEAIPWEEVSGTYELHPFSIILEGNILENYKGFVLYGEMNGQQQELFRGSFADQTLDKLREVYLNEDPNHGPAVELQEALEEAGHHVHELEEFSDLATIKAEAIATLALVDALRAAASEFHEAADEVKAIDNTFEAKHAVVIQHCETELPEALDAVRPLLQQVVDATDLTSAQSAAAEAHDLWHGHDATPVSSIVRTILITMPKFDVGEGLKEDEHSGHNHGN